MISSFRLSAGLALAGFMCMTSPGWADTQTDAIAARQVNQKVIGELADTLRKAAAANTPVASLAPQTTELAERAHRQAALFALKTDAIGNSKSKPEIWTQPEAFAEASARFVAAADKLDMLAKAGDTAGFADQLKITGGTCGACHREFRNR